MAQLREPPPVPTTSIYSRSDGIVAWRCSVNEPARWPRTSRCTPAMSAWASNPLALYAVADRLAQTPGQWKPFEPTGARRWFFRTHPDASEPARA